MAITIEPLNCGSLTAPRSMFERGASEDQLTIPVPAWLIRHPDGLVLLDTGMHEDLSVESEFLELVSNFFDVGCPRNVLIAERLATHDVDVADIDIVIATHLHFDHIGGLGAIPNARLMVQSTEWAAGFDPDLASANSFRREDFDLGHDVVQLDGEHDVFGDGRVRCIPTPGHTPGHQSLIVQTNDREVVLCGDCAYFESTLAGGPLPSFGHDAEQQAASVALLRSLRDAGALVIPGHDPVTFRTLPAVIGAEDPAEPS